MKYQRIVFVRAFHNSATPHDNIDLQFTQIRNDTSNSETFNRNVILISLMRND